MLKSLGNLQDRCWLSEVVPPGEQTSYIILIAISHICANDQEVAGDEEER